MLEFPESLVYAKQIHEKMVEKQIVSVVMNQSPHKFAFFTRNAEEYPLILEGLVVKGCRNFGGMIEIDFDEYKLVFADGAYPRCIKPGAKRPLKHQMQIEFEDDSAITVSIQMYGFISLMKQEDTTNAYYQIAVTKPSPLDQAFTYEYFKSIYDGCSKKLSVKALLATEQRIPGLGNGVLQDILYQAGIHPKRKLDTFVDKDIRKIYESIRTVLGEMLEQGGRDTEKDFYGYEGNYITYLSKKTYLTPCPKCGYEISKAAYMGGTVYYCEKCQPL